MNTPSRVGAFFSVPPLTRRATTLVPPLTRWATTLVSLLLFAVVTVGLEAQPSFTAPPPSTAPVEDPALRRDQYLARRMEALRWRAAMATPGDPTKLGLAEIAAKLALRKTLRRVRSG